MHLKLATRLIISSLLISIIPILIISSYSLYISSGELEGAVNSHLLQAREETFDNLGDYFAILEKQLATLADRDIIVDSIKSFNMAIDGLDVDLGKRYDADLAANEGMLKARYAYQEANTANVPKDAINRWWPQDRAARILQHYYIAANPYPANEKNKN